MHRRKFLLNSGIAGAGLRGASTGFSAALRTRRRIRFRTKSKFHTGGNTRGIYRPTASVLV